MSAPRATPRDMVGELTARYPWLTDDDEAVPDIRHLPGKHDQDDHGKGGGGSGGSGGSGGGSGTKPAAKPAAKKTMTDEEYEARTALIESKVGDAIKNDQTTDALYAIDMSRGVWSMERAVQHREIVNALYASAANVPSDGKVVIAGGLGGAGKSTVLKKFAGVDPSQFLTLNPDDVKEEMADRGMIPDIEGLSPMEASALVHEESSHIANLVAKRAYAERKNVIWDITMSSKGSVERRINELRGAGYDDMSAVFVDIPVETSVERALSRHRRGADRFLNGEGKGGRYVPPSIIRKNESSTTSSANREVFDALLGEFDAWSLYDNSGTAPVFMADSTQGGTSNTDGGSNSD